MALEDLKILLVVLLCLPVAAVGAWFVSTLFANALAGKPMKKKKSLQE
ncbi:MAG: hypothetical protein LBR00_01035 [Clostridiales Family XIII bacterium]|nr:hypothetical protein [Clostridiales Family XIII bacterium]